MKQSINGYQYEHQCADKLKKSGFDRVTVTKGSGDQGIDVIAYKNGDKYGIQCKYYSSPVGNFAVQEAYAGAKHYNCKYAVVLTNNTFTKSAKDLAKSTGVLLWERDKIPSSIGESKIIKWIGIFICIVSILGLITIGNAENAVHPTLQRIYMVLLIIGGLCNIIEYGNFAMDFLACIFYFIAMVLHLFWGGIDEVILVVFLICLIRMLILYRKTNKSAKQFTKDFNKQIVSNESSETYESVQQEINNILQNMGNTYVDFFKEQFYVESVLLKANSLDNKSNEFILKVDTEEQARYLLSKEPILNANLDHMHKITLLANNTISLIVTGKG